MTAAPETLALYLHWPFCEAKCPYCDFNSHVTASVDHDRWRRAFLSELDRTAAETHGRIVTSVFIGGGTPSLMEPWVVAAILDRIAALWPLAPDVEISMEANPSSVEAERLSGFRAAGVGRVSLGVQALVDADLRRLGRLHNVGEALAAMETARSIFPRTSFDLIYARQDQTPEAWSEELVRALSFEPDHLSLYQLTIEPGTPFARRADRGTLRGLPDEDAGADMFEATQALCDEAGLPAYEISNHARPGAECRHNITYWTGGDWAGIGPGAHGRLTLGTERVATVGHLAPGAWLGAVEAGSGDASRNVIPTDEADEERVLMGLRLARGLDLGALSSPFAETMLRKAKPLAEMGLLTTTSDRIALTPKGRPLLDAVLREML